MRAYELLEGEVGTRRTLFNIVRGVRRWAEKLVTDKQYDDTLTGLCAISSGELWKRLNAAGIEAKIYQFKREFFGSHCWVEAEGYLIDVTGSQFLYPKIIIRKIDNIPAAYEWLQKSKQGGNEFKVSKSAKTLRQSQQKLGWPENQIAYK